MGHVDVKRVVEFVLEWKQQVQKYFIKWVVGRLVRILVTCRWGASKNTGIFKYPNTECLRIREQG
jgi:hypothetical protein